MIGGGGVDLLFKLRLPLDTKAPRALRVIMLVQKVDESDWLLGFSVGWIRALAARVNTVDVVTLEQRSASLPANVRVHSLGKERHAGRIREFVTFQRAISGLMRQADVIFGHLTPRYTWLAAPWAAFRHVPQCLWYTHRQTNWELKLAVRACRWIATAASNSFPMPGPKVHVLGHGIDAMRFTPGDSIPEADPPLILAVGRLAPIKRHDVLLEAAALLRDRGISARFAIAGGVASAEGVAYRAQLEARIAALGLADQFALLGAVQGDALLTWYRRASIVTNLSPAGLFDKAALEAMFMARPVVVTNPDFDEVLSDQSTLLRLPNEATPAQVAERLAGLLARSAQDRAAIGTAIRERAVQLYSLDQLMDRLVALWTA